MSDPLDLNGLLLNLDGLSDCEAYELGEKAYRENFIPQGERTGRAECHDGCTVVFFEDRFWHAFKTSNDRARMAYSKDKVARDRIERIGWIRPFLKGEVSAVECWLVPRKVPDEAKDPFPPKRLYVSWQMGYLLWLEPLKNGSYKFSSAYVAPRAEIARYTGMGRKLWTSAP